MKIEIAKATEEPVKEGTGQNGKPYRIREQEAWLHIDQMKYPQRVKIPLNNGIAPYAVGMYVVADESYIVGKYLDLRCMPVLRSASEPMRMTGTK